MLLVSVPAVRTLREVAVRKATAMRAIDQRATAMKTTAQRTIAQRVAVLRAVRRRRAALLEAAHPAAAKLEAALPAAVHPVRVAIRLLPARALPVRQQQVARILASTPGTIPDAQPQAIPHAVDALPVRAGLQLRRRTSDVHVSN